jgi:hypothetical protein
MASLIMVVFVLFGVGCQEKPSQQTGDPAGQPLQNSAALADKKQERRLAVGHYFESLVEVVSTLDVHGFGGDTANVHPRRLRRPYPTRDEIEAHVGAPDETNAAENTVRWEDWEARFSNGDGRLDILSQHLPSTPFVSSGIEEIHRDARRWSLSRLGGA